MAKFILDSKSISNVNYIIGKLDSLIREDIFPRNADEPKQYIKGSGNMIISWRIHEVANLLEIKLTFDTERNVTMEFIGLNSKFTFDPESNYEKADWHFQLAMKAFQEFWIAYFKKTDETN